MAQTGDTSLTVVGHYINVSFSHLFPTCLSSPFLGQVRSPLPCGWCIFPNTPTPAWVCACNGVWLGGLPAGSSHLPSLSLFSVTKTGAEGIECERAISSLWGRQRPARQRRQCSQACAHKRLEPLPQSGLSAFWDSSQVWRQPERPLLLSARHWDAGFFFHNLHKRQIQLN